jgi:hypothetical protein
MKVSSRHMTGMRMKMTTTDQYTNKVLMEAQRLLWGGSESENIEAHNMIAKLINDRMGQA